MRKLCASLRLGNCLRSSIATLTVVLALVLICQSAALGQTITLDAPASHSTSQYGQPVTVSGTVSPADDWTVVVYDGHRYLGSAAVSGGNYSFTTRSLSAGYHAFWVYGVNAGAVRQQGIVMHTVNAAPSSGFAPAVPYAVDGGASGLTVADFDGNGTADLYVACGLTLVTPLSGTGDGTFTKGTQLTVGTDIRSIASGDFNRDGLTDFVATSFTDNTIKIYLANGSGGWNTQSLSTGTGPVDVVADDFNADAKLDIAVVNRTSNDVSIFVGDGAGNFAPKVDFPNAGGPGTTPYSIAVMNYNGDSYLDIVLASDAAGATPLTVLPSTGPASFGAAVPYGGGNWSAEVADVDQNGHEDVVSMERGVPSYVYIARGNTAGTLTPIHSYSTPDNTGRFAIADIDGDGNLDIAMVVESTNSVRVLYGDGTGAFGGARDFAVGTTPHAVKAGDFNGDGRTDLAVANKGDSTVSILLGQGPDLTITKTLAYHPHQGETGVPYTITVTNSGDWPTSGTVTVVDNFPAAGMTATAISGAGWSCTLGTLTCTRSDVLAAGGSYEPITLTVDIASDAVTGILNSATVSGGGEANTANDTAYNSATIIQVVDLAIYMERAPATFTVGQTATFTMGVQNNGPLPTWGTIRVVDTLPTGLTATALSGTGWTCDLPTLRCERTDSIAVGSFYPDITLTVTVGSGATPSVTNTAEVQSGGDYTNTNNYASATVTVNPATGPDLFVQKHHSGNFYKGQVGAMYTLDAYNNGGSNSSGTVTVADTFPVGLTFNHIGTLAAGWSCTNTATSFSCSTSGAVAPGAISPGITVYVNVARDAVPVVNVATIAGGGDVDTNNNQSNDPSNIVDVPTTTTVTGSGTWGGTTFTAVVTPVLPIGVTISGTPTGTVTFMEGATTLGTATLDGSGQATFSTSTMSMGPRTITVNYAGDTQFAASSGTTTFDVPAAPTTVTATGGTVTYPATIVIPVAVTSPVGTPTGNIEVSLGGGAPTPYTLSAGGTFDVNFILHAGAHALTITYPAQGNYATSTRAVTVNVNQAATTTALTSAANPAPVSTSVTFTATVTGPVGGVTPTGTVTFLDGASSIGTGTLNASGVATLTTTTLASGNHTVTAVYAGDSDYLTSTSAAVAQTIGRPQVTFPSGTSSLTVVAGQFGRVTLNVGATGTLTGPVTFVCSGLPEGSTCAFNPSTVGPTVPATISVTIQTTGFRIVGADRHSSFGITFAMLIPGMLLIPAAFRRNRRLAIVLGLIAIAALMLGLVGCGGGNHVQGITNGANATPAGTYVVTVTGSSTGADSGTMTINLTVTQ